MNNKIEIIIFQNDNGKEPFIDWINRLDNKIKIRIFSRLNRVTNNNLGDFKNLGDGLFELKFNFGSGYRIYFGRDNKKIILLLCGGNKRTQTQDIKKSRKYLIKYENQKK